MRDFSAALVGDFAAVARLFLPQCVVEWFENEGFCPDIRRRKLTRPVLLLSFIHYALEGFANLTDSMSRAHANLIQGNPIRISSGSATPARRRLPVEVLRHALAYTVDLATDGARPQLCGFREIAIDGTTFSTADSKANARAYGRPKASRGRSAYPRMRAALAMDAGTHTFIAERHGHYNTPEVELVDALLPDVCAEGVLIELDRGLTHFDRLVKIRELGAHVLGRIKSNVKLAVHQRLSDGSYLSVMRHNRHRHCGLPLGEHHEDLPVRVICYRVSQGRERGKVIRLVTTVTDPEQLPAALAVEGFARRWDIEVGIRELKQMRQRFLQPCFPGRSKASVEQEYYAMLTAHTALRCLMVHAAKENGTDATRLSLSGTRQVLAAFLETTPRKGQADEWARALASEIARCRLPDRSPRTFARAVKRKMSRYPTQVRSRRPSRAALRITILHRH